MSAAPPLGLYLDALFGAEPADGLLEARWRREGGRGMGQLFHGCERRASVVETIESVGRRTDLYVGVAPRRRRHGGKDAIDRVHALWADCDGAEAVRALERFSPAPAIVVGSGTGGNAHAYWPLWPPASPAEAERANRRLAHALGADAAATDAARILRPPGTFNHKGERPALVTLEHLAVEVYELEQVVGELPDPPAPQRERHEGTPISADDPLVAVDPPTYVELLTGRQVGRDGKARCPFHAGGEERTPSLHAYATPEQGWYCYGCERGGGIIDLGAELYGIEPRGAGYQELRRRLARELLGRSAA